METTENNYEQMLLRRASKNELAHFYVVESDSSESANHANEWIKQKLLKIICTQTKKNYTNLENYLDLLLLRPSDEKYIVEDLEEIYRFLTYAPLQAKTWKFILIEEGQFFSQTIWNKLLKILEEPQPFTSIFITVPQDTVLLPTIKSRAQFIYPFMSPRLKNKDRNLLEILKNSHFKTWTEFNSWIKENEIKEDDFLNTLILLHRSKCSIKQLSELTNVLQKYPLWQTFHASHDSRWVQYYQLFQQWRTQ